MSTNLNAAPAHLPALNLPRRNWQRWVSMLVSLALLGAILIQFNHLGTTRLAAVVPRTPIFWLGIVTYYLTLPASEWVIFRRLWRLPVGGFAVLLRKLVSNEVLFGYSGELSFYAWARRHSGLTNAPFGAIKDVSITSALAGNLFTLLMLALSWPFFHTLPTALNMHAMAASVGVVLVGAMLVGLFNRQLFSLPGREIGMMLGVHLTRLVITTTLSAVIWHSAMPEVALSLWIVLAALQLLVTRLPFIPNKDLVFANVTLMVVGPHSDIGPLIALIATIILAMHLLIGGLLAIVDLLDEGDAR